MKTLIRILILTASPFFIVACASTAPQTDKLLEQPPNVPERYEVSSVPFVEQKEGYCGPASMAMVLQWNGLQYSADELAPKIFTPKMKGAFQEDMVSAARRLGMMAIEIEGMNNLIREIAGGHPVIVFENLGVSWYQQWHYAVAFGYDLPNKKLILHSGPDEHDAVNLKVFERSWVYSDYWGLVLLPAGELAVTGDEIAHLKAAAGLEKVGMNREAQMSYESILDRWPGSLAALIGLGNLAFAEGDYRGAVKFLEKAVTNHPESEAARHNLAVARDHLKSKRVAL